MRLKKAENPQESFDMDKDALAGGWFVGPFIMIIFFAIYYGFFDMDFGLKGNLFGSIGVTAGISIVVIGILYKMDQMNSE